MNFDENGAIGSLTWKANPEKQTTERVVDFGDAPAETGRWHQLVYHLTELGFDISTLPYHSPDDFLRAVNGSMRQNSYLVRDPDVWNDPRDMSRDQLGELVKAASLLRHQHLVDEIDADLTLAWGFYPNGDFASPEHWGWFYRHKKFMFKSLFFSFSDLFMLLNSIIICVRALFWPDDVKNDLNHITSLAHAKRLYPTFVSMLATKIYFWFRPLNVNLPADYLRKAIPQFEDVTLDMIPSPVLATAKYYEQGGNDRMVQLYYIVCCWLSNTAIYMKGPL